MRQRQNPCVIVSDLHAAQRLPDWRFRLCAPHCCAARAAEGRYPFRAAPGCGASRMLGDKLHRAAETVGSEAAGRTLPPPCRLPGERFRPTALLKSSAQRSGMARVRFKRVPPSHPARFHGTDRDFRPVPPRKGYGRLMGSDAHPRILRLAPLNSGRIVYLHLSQTFRQYAVPKSCNGIMMSWK